MNYPSPAATSVALHKRPNIGIPYVGSSNEVERKVVTIWEGLLGVQGIGIQDDFFELGGHSLLAVRLVERIDQAFEVNISINSLLENATVEHQAQLLGPMEEPTQGLRLSGAEPTHLRRPFGWSSPMDLNHPCSCGSILQMERCFIFAISFETWVTTSRCMGWSGGKECGANRRTLPSRTALPSSSETSEPFNPRGRTIWQAIHSVE